MNLRKIASFLFLRCFLLSGCLVGYEIIANTLVKYKFQFGFFMAPLSFPFLLFSRETWVGQNGEFITGLIFWATFTLVWVALPRRWTRPQKGEPFFEASPQILGWTVLFILLAFALRFMFPSSVSGSVFICSPFLPIALPVLRLSGQGQDIAYWLQFGTVPFLLYWSVFALIIRRAKAQRAVTPQS